MKRRGITILVAALLCAGLIIGFIFPFLAQIAQSMPKATATPAQEQALDEEEIPLAVPETDAPDAPPVSTPKATPAPTATQKPMRTVKAVPTPTVPAEVEPGTTVIIEDDPIPIAEPEE